MNKLISGTFVLIMSIALACSAAAGAEDPAPAAPAAPAPGSLSAPATGPGELFGLALKSYSEGEFKKAADEAIMCASTADAGKWEGRAIFLAARSFSAMKDVERAEAYFEGAVERYPALADYSLYLLAGAYLDNGMDAQAAAAYTRLAEEHPKSRLANGALMSAARAYVKLEGYGEAVETLDRLLGKRPPSETAAEALHLKARALESLGDAQAAGLIEHGIWLEYPESRFADEARAFAGRAGDKKGPARPTYAERVKRADRLFGKGRYEAASEEYGAAIKTMPADMKAAAHFRLGECRFNTRRYEDAAKEFALALKLGAGERAAEATYRMAWSYLRAGDGDAFRRAALSCAKRYPKSDWAAESLFILGAEYVYDEKYEDAVKLFEGILGGYKSSPLRPEVLWRLGWANYKNGGFAAAADAFDRLAASYPSSALAPSALYWRAKSLDSGGEPARAAGVYERLDKEYGLSFYAFLAEGKAGAARPAESVIGPQALFPVKESYDDPALARAMELGVQGMAGEGASEARRAEGRYSGSVWGLKVLAGLYGFLGEYRRPLELASHSYRTRINTGKEPIPDEVLRMAFPLGYRDTVLEQAAAFGVDPLLVFSLIREESHFDPCVVSPAGAVGLMQLMPKTARMLCAKLMMEFPTSDSLKDYCFNVPLGSCYIASLIEKHDGRLVYALAEYNAGAEALSRWRKRMPDAPDDEFIEGISYPETRNYVKRVLRNYRIYRMLYGG